jgi:uncharacterized protein (TIGR00251 family)
VTTTLAVKVIPRAAADAITAWVDGVLKIRVTAPPQDGRANAAVEALLARALDVRKSAVRIVSGHASAHKRVAVDGLDRAEVERRLNAVE